jgi:hypothetical protein
VNEIFETPEQKLLKAISENEETVISSMPSPQMDAKEPRLNITINGPARLLQQLMDILT